MREGSDIYSISTTPITKTDEALALDDAKSIFIDIPCIEVEKLDGINEIVSKREIQNASRVIILGDCYLNDTLQFKEVSQ